MASPTDLRGARIVDDASASSESPLRDDTAEFIRELRARAEDGGSDEISKTTASAFDFALPATVTRAPGRLDFMGGIADYSGSLVLQMPIAEACHVAAQTRAAPRGRATLTVVSPILPGSSTDANDRAETFTCAMDDLLSLTYDAAREWFARDPKTRWAAYVAGTALVLAKEKGARFQGQSVSMFVRSAVPEGKGVSSSAACEVASMRALAVLANVPFDGDEGGAELAALCQLCENAVAGAPCGIMDQMTASLGRESRLLALLCSNNAVLGHVRIPRGCKLWGIDSGVRHSNDGESDYGRVRCAAFMFREHLKQTWPEKGIDHLATSVDPRWLEVMSLNGALPKRLSGENFLVMYPEGHGDDVTSIDERVTYDVAVCGSHPMMEHRRVTLIRDWLAEVADDDAISELVATQVGNYMYQSHESYGACGLGSDATDKLVRLLEERGRDRGVFGAKITGGGSGGVVCALTADTDDAERAVAEVCDEYGGKPAVFVGSSPGAVSFGHLSVVIKPSD